MSALQQPFYRTEVLTELIKKTEARFRVLHALASETEAAAREKSGKSGAREPEKHAAPSIHARNPAALARARRHLVLGRHEARGFGEAPGRGYVRVGGTTGAGEQEGARVTSGEARPTTVTFRRRGERRLFCARRGLLSGAFHFRPLVAERRIMAARVHNGSARFTGGARHVSGVVHFVSDS